MTEQPDAKQPKVEKARAQRTGAELSYEDAREELVEVVRRLETGGTNLEESLALWERGEKLAQICQGWLDGAKKRLDAAIAEGEPDQDATR